MISSGSRGLESDAQTLGAGELLPGLGAAGGLVLGARGARSGEA